MKAKTVISTIITEDGEGTYGIQAEAAVTFVQDDGVLIIGTKILSPGVWGIGGWTNDNGYFASLAQDEIALLGEMLTALAMTDVSQLMPDTDTCDNCGALLSVDEGEGYDGLCGSCADLKESDNE